MENTKQWGSINCPSILDFPNYDYWKAHMVAFLDSMDIKTWKRYYNGWTPQTIIHEDNFVYGNPQKD